MMTRATQHNVQVAIIEQDRDNIAGQEDDSFSADSSGTPDDLQVDIKQGNISADPCNAAYCSGCHRTGQR